MLMGTPPRSREAFPLPESVTVPVTWITLQVSSCDGASKSTIRGSIGSLSWRSNHLSFASMLSERPSSFKRSVPVRRILLPNVGEDCLLDPWMRRPRPSGVCRVN